MVERNLLLVFLGTPKNILKINDDDNDIKETFRLTLSFQILKKWCVSQALKVWKILVAQQTIEMALLLKPEYPVAALHLLNNMLQRKGTIFQSQLNTPT